MTELYAGVNGHTITRLRLTVANVGPWIAECDFDDDAADVGGAVTLVVGTLELKGTVDAGHGGVEAGQRRLRIVGGGGGWSNLVAPKGYHNDAGVKALVVAQDAARAVGESLGTFVPVAERVGNDYAREAGPASRALEDVIGGVPWWVGYDGLTYVGTRPAVAVDAKAYEVLAYNPRERIVTLSVDDPGAVVVGSILSERLDTPQTVRELELTVNAGELRIVAWCGGSEAGPGRLAGLMRSIVERATDGHLLGKYRYRVIGMQSGRVQCQAVRKGAGLPDLIPVPMWPGIPGAHAELSPGAEVLVEFIEGNRAMPIVTHFAGKDGPGFVPVSLILGGSEGVEAARKGDAVEVILLPAVFSGTVNGTPATGVITFASNKAVGTITGGSSKVKVAS